ncbi:MAG: phage portal protein family protein [bacterium]
MFRTDPTVKAGIEFIRLSILSRLTGYQNTSYPDVEEFIRLALESMEGSLWDLVQDLLSALWAGFSVAEIIYKPFNGKMIWKRIKVINPVSLYPEGIKMDEKGRILKIVQRVGGEEIEIPLKRCVIWSFASEFGNPWGNSLLRPAYSPWLMKQLLIRLWNIHLERQATPFGVVSLPQAEMMVWCPIHQKEERYIEAMKHIMEDLHNRNSLIYTGGAEVRFERLEGKGELFESAIRYYDSQILRALLIPSLLVTEGEYGTRAQAIVHQEAFQMMLSGIIRELKAVLDEQVFRPLIELNFGEIRDWGGSVFKPFADSDYAVWADVLTKLTSSGWLSPREKEDVERVKEIIGWR